MNGMEDSKPPLKFDKNFFFSLAAVLILVALGGWLYVSGTFKGGGDGAPGSCLVLPERYCGAGIAIEYLDSEAMAFSLPDGTPIYAPFDGTYSDETPEGLAFVIARLGISGADGFVVMVGRHAPYLESGVGVKAGDLLGVSVDDPDFALVDDETGANFVIYTIDYDIKDLF